MLLFGEPNSFFTLKAPGLLIDLWSGSGPLFSMGSSASEARINELGYCSSFKAPAFSIESDSLISCTVRSMFAHFQFLSFLICSVDEY